MTVQYILNERCIQCGAPVSGKGFCSRRCELNRQRLEDRAIALRAAGLALYANGGRSDDLALRLLDKADNAFRKAGRLRREPQ